MVSTIPRFVLESFFNPGFVEQLFHRKALELHRHSLEMTMVLEVLGNHHWSYQL